MSEDVHGGDTLDTYDRDGGSPTPIITDEELRRAVVRGHRAMVEIRTALKGNDLGTEGLVPQGKRHEVEIRSINYKIMGWAGAYAILAVVAVWILYHLKP